jgi:hypothetical protein
MGKGVINIPATWRFLCIGWGDKQGYKALCAPQNVRVLVAYDLIYWLKIYLQICNISHIHLWTHALKLCRVPTPESRRHARQCRSWYLNRYWMLQVPTTIGWLILQTRPCQLPLALPSDRIVFLWLWYPLSDKAVFAFILLYNRHRGWNHVHDRYSPPSRLRTISALRRGDRH